MHHSHVPTEATDRVAWMRGTHNKIKLDPTQTTHVVVDLQVGFMGEGSLLEALRSTGGSITYVQYKFNADEPHRRGTHYDSMTPDTPGLDVQPEDLVVPKTQWSAFIPGTCDLDALLKARDIDTLIVTGTTTNICCESTMPDAMQMGYNVLFEQDGNATRDYAVHNASLLNMLFLGDVVTAEEAIARIEARLRPESSKNEGSRD